MKRKLHKLLIMLCSLTLLLSTPMTVLASEGEAVEEGKDNDPDSEYGSDMYVQAPPDAIDEILDDERFEGAVEQIQWLTKKFDFFSIQVISVCAFLIIAAALLKNVFAGVYCANSKFWDKVADAHAKKDALNLSMIKGYFQGGQYQNTTVAGFKDGILALLPNIKSFTDFDDADIQPTQYFMKSIPQMCLCVIIGIFIYNGYYRDTAAVVGEFGSEVFNRVMTAASPSEFLDKITQTTGMPTLLTDGLTDPQGKILNKIADAGRKACITEYTLTSNAQKIRVSACVENWVLHDSGIQEWVERHSQDEEDNAWKISAKVKLVPATSSSTEGLGEDSDEATTHVKVFMTESPVVAMGGSDGAWIMDSTEASKSEKQTLYLRVALTAVKTESSGGKNAGKSVDGSNAVESSKQKWGDDVTLHVTIDPSVTETAISNSIDGYTLICTSSSRWIGTGAQIVNKDGQLMLKVPDGFTKGTYPFVSSKVYAIDDNDVRHKVYLSINE